MLNALQPLCGDAPRILVLGSFPSPLSRDKSEYYGNPKNHFWRVIYHVLGAEFDAPSYGEKARLLAENGIALWDVITQCNAENALDSSIKNPIYNKEIPDFVREKEIRHVFFNGGNARIFYKRGIGPPEGIVLPSTSPANARMRWEEKAAIWREAVLPCLNNMTK